ncbi:protein Star-like [Oratosquilla oratoria]|uniref:protein Star-like n=1 Tax=Oratosquilla oratoria TaxID=337810 RepID=UPI003F7701ED
MHLDKTKINKYLWVILGVILAAFGFLLILQMFSSLLGSSTSVCSKRACLSKYFEGPPAYNSPALASYLKKNYFNPGASSPYSLSGIEGHDPELKETLNFIKEYFEGKKGGTFVELGAGDGEYRSYTLELEKDFDWRGLLIEPNIELYDRLLKKGRKAVSTNNCVSPFAYPTKMALSYPDVKSQSEEETIRNLGNTKIDRLWEDKSEKKYIAFESQCVPLENLLYTAGIKDDIDLLVLTMNGSDLDVILNVRLDVIPEIEMIVVVSNGVDVNQDVGGYFLERNMVIEKVVGKDPKNATYILRRFEAK